jgi:nucleotide-binding universal stress UspA family protein
MFNKVMVGVDGEAGGRDAIALARKLVAHDGEVIEAQVRPLYPAKFAVIPPIESNITVGEPTASHHLRTVANGSKVRRIVSTSVGRGLRVLADESDVDLLVVGSTRRGIFGRVLTGDGTQEAINGARCAVAVAPAGYARHPNPFTSVGVAYNGSTESECALDVARTLAAAHGAQVSAMEVVNFPTYAYVEGAGVPTAELTQPMLDEARARLEALGDLEPNVRFGATAQELTQYSDTVSLLIVGARDYGPVGRLVHSSTSRSLARGCGCPLLILTRGSLVRDSDLIDAALSRVGSADRDARS